ncbi:MAG TPA: extracellular solute-binding protein [Candidatus Limnocylindrales bacterium]|nr:extracellular solute-binding protein [Candidatus Limnocylindrales bacterium]
MSARSFRPGGLVLALALAASACGPSTSSPSGSAGSAPPPSTGGAPSAPASAGAAASFPTDPVTIKWYCCLGGGDAPEQVAIQKKVAADVQKKFPNITVDFEAIPYDAARDTLATQIASGNGPDIVGPLGIGGANAFPGQWLDLTDLIAKYQYDTSQFPANIVDIYKLGTDGQVGIPFAVYPSALFYKKGLFEEAGLNEPPHKYGDKYTLPDGTQVDWNYDTLRQIALKLTVDANGKDASEAGFDPKKIVQYGFEPQRDDLRGLGAYFGPGSLDSGDGKTAKVPAPWATGWKFFYDAMWKDHITMTGPVYQSTEFNGGGYSFFSGKVAMSENFLWSTYGVADAGDDWDLAAIPSNGGTTTAAFNADTFRIMKSSKNPDAAFAVLTYLLGEGSTELLQTYGGMPAREAEQDAFFETLGKSEGFPAVVDWQVAKDGIEYADEPNFEAPMPKYNESLDLLGTFLTKWTSTAGLSMDAEIASLEQQLSAIWTK